jgi:hypothetical protein
MLILLLILFIFLLLFFVNYEKFNITEEKNNYVCIFAYYEKNDTYKENLNYFINNGIYDNIDYFIIINGNCTIDIPKKQNINVVYRENKGYDFGAWNYCVNQILKKSYDYYIFLNSSVRGPYLDNNKNWLDEYLKLFNDPDVKLVGSSINIYINTPQNFDSNLLEKLYKSKGPYTHVQSMFFILSSEGFEFLKINDFFNKDYDNFIDLIIYKEIGMSQMILKNNWNINCILSKYSNYDYRKVNDNFNPTGTDPYWKNAYFGESINPYEVIFYKNNRYS